MAPLKLSIAAEGIVLGERRVPAVDELTEGPLPSRGRIAIQPRRANRDRHQPRSRRFTREFYKVLPGSARFCGRRTRFVRRPEMGTF